ncbi:MAG: uroporphyrinogen-III C-methyltransferase [Gammaproteobacteria bacterium]|nr:uroporphyrinogen-III C-methyltransferase [Gammaproteobacteria bacterium]
MSKKENTIINIDEENEHVSEPSKELKKEKSSSANGIIIFLILIIIACSSMAAYYFWDLQLKHSRTIKTQQQSIEELNVRLTKVADEFNKNSKVSESNTTKLESLENQLQQTEVISQKAIAIVNRSQRDWALAEIDYLLKIAHQRIAVARDINGAIAALKGADSRLEQLGDLNLFNIRKQLANDIANLNAIHRADVNGISLALDQAIAYLPELPFKSIKDEIKIQFNEDVTVEQETVKEKDFVDSVIDAVKQIGDIKVHRRSIQAASSADQQSSIEQLLRTYILGARLAALRFDQIQFIHEINQASEIIRLHYDESDNRIQQLQKTLLDYSALQLSPDLPELTKAWTLLQEVKSTAETKTTLIKDVNKEKEKEAN